MLYYMKFFIFTCLALSVLSQEIHPFRYRKGTVNIGKGDVVVSGSAIFQNDSDILIIEYYGMDASTMTPFMIQATTSATRSSNVNDNMDIVFDCSEGRWSDKQNVELSGTLNFTGNWDKAEIKGYCTTKDDEEWIINSNGMEKKATFFSYEEAAMRAKLLMGQSAEHYSTSSIISYAVLDYPYTGLNCEQILARYPTSDISKAGIIIVGKDGKHCGIVASEGEKFIHTDPHKKVVIDTFLSLAMQFFPNGFLYKAYPVKN